MMGECPDARQRESGETDGEITRSLQESLQDVDVPKL